MSKFLLLISAVLLMGSTTLAQGELEFDIKLEESTDKFDVVSHHEDSKLADSLEVSGTIVRSYGGICGDLCSGGTLKLKVESKIDRYKYEYMYIVFPCTEQHIEEQEITLYVTHYTGKEQECYYKDVINIVDSQGIPFYKITEEEAQKLTK